MKKQGSRFLPLSGSVETFRDAITGETLLTVTGSRGVFIENYRSILFYSDTCIRIQAGLYVLAVCGKNLTIRYYDKDEMRITGRMEAIRFE